MNDKNENSLGEQAQKRKKIFEFYVNNNQLNISKYRHKDNTIDTTKYNIVTFLPKSLFFQFLRIANIYFLIIAILQSIPYISPLSPVTAIAPLVFVLCVSIIREGLEDLARHKYEAMLNNEPVKVYRKCGFVNSISASLRVGEVIVVQENTNFPADMILLDSNLEEGVAYIETATLDGEKTLKGKIAHKETSTFFKTDNSGNWKESFVIEGKCECDSPNPDLNKLEGNLELFLRDPVTGLSKSMKIPLEHKQLLLKGAILKQTKWVIGIVLYTGHNNKLILNSKNPRVKYSTIERLMSKMLFVILISQSILCIASACIYASLYVSSIRFYDLLIPITSPEFEAFLSYFTYLLLLNTMIPISLIITLEIVKAIQGYFIKADCGMYSHVRKKFAEAGSISLNEELGQVNYIFSDKTGTLTCNKMEFKYCVIGDCCYEFKKTLEKGLGKMPPDILPIYTNYNKNQGVNSVNKTNIHDEEEKFRSELNIKPFGPQYMEEFVKLNSYAINKSKFTNYYIRSYECPSCKMSMQDERIVVNEFWKAIACAHECVCNDTDTGVEYSGLSPDDVELVKMASIQGFRFMKSYTDKRKIVIGSEERVFPILNILPFTSDRKRMSIIIRDGNLIKLYSKGADSEIKLRLSRESRQDFFDTATVCVDKFSSRGYRTLMVSMKVIDEKEYQVWLAKLHEAELNLQEKERLVDICYNEIEQNQYLLGATIVEDKLQDKVPETIRDLRLAGIKIWMLTGDKVDTAENIALSCNLISRSHKNFKLKRENGLARTQSDVGAELEQFFTEFNNFVMTDQESETIQPFSIIIEATILAGIFKTQEITRQFFEIAMNASAVVCCRVSPLQKSQVVKVMKEYDPSSISLAIGDGGNDVSMIMEAHIGVGVYGEEGMRAVQASDYAIGEFKILRRLLFFHGRTNNIRISEMILYFFFKNFVFTLLHFYYAFYNLGSGQTIIDDWFISFYNMIFTALPLGVRAVSDFDIKEEDGKLIEEMMPFLYNENRAKPLFTKKRFVSELFQGCIYALINFYSVYIGITESGVDGAGNIADIWYISLSLFTNLIFLVSFRLLIGQKFIIFLVPVIMFITSWIFYFGFAMLVHFSLAYNSTGTMIIAFTSGKFYLTTIFVVVVTFFMDFGMYSFNILFSDSLVGILKVLYSEQKMDDIDHLPDCIKEELKGYEKYENYNNYSRINQNENNSANIKDISKIDAVSNLEYLKVQPNPPSRAKSNRDHDPKMFCDLELMEKPYNKKFSQELESLFNEERSGPPKSLSNKVLVTVHNHKEENIQKEDNIPEVPCDSVINKQQNRNNRLILKDNDENYPRNKNEF